MVKIMNGEFRRVNWLRAARTLHACAAVALIVHSSVLLVGQQPQAPAGTPLYSVNAKYVNGMAPGYWPTAGSGLTLSLSAGTAYCGNPPVPAGYPGGSLTLTASATNYVYLNPANNCGPAASTSAFKAGEIPIAKVVTGASSITSITDARTWFQPQPCATGSAGDLQCSSLGTNQNISLTPSGTGASVITNLEDKGGQVFNVRAYGAKGDGITNDSPAVQAAYDAAVSAGGGTVYIPPTTSCYLLSTAINMTEDKHVVKIVGAGGHSATDPSNYGNICGNTGGVLFDLTNSSNKTLQGLNVTAQNGVTNPSTIGILFARDSAGNSGGHDYVIECKFSMPLHTSGTTYSFGAYLYGQELTYMTRDVLIADYPLVVDAYNQFGVTSPFVTLATGAQSETQDSFTDMELDTYGLGNAAYFNGTWDMILTGHSYNFTTTSPYPSSLQQYALSFTSTFAMHLKWRQEGFPGFLHNKLYLQNSQIYGTAAPFANSSTLTSVHAVEFDDASSVITHDDFAIMDEYPFATINYFFDSSENAVTPGVAVLDDVDFACGGQTNCVNIPVGNYDPGYSTYWKDVRWSGGSSTTEYPNVQVVDSLSGSFSVPATSVAANSCTELTGFTSVAAARAAQPVHFTLSPDFINGLNIHMSGYSGTTTPQVCNPTSSPITPPVTTVHWRLGQ